MNITNPQQSSAIILAMKLSEWAEREGVHYQTAWRWFRDGKMPVPTYKAPSGAILVDLPHSGSSVVSRVALYARVSSHDQRADLDRQVARLTEWTTSKDMVVSEDMTEVLTNFCARLYGRRGARNRAEKALRCAKADISPRALSHPSGRI